MDRLLFNHTQRLILIILFALSFTSMAQSIPGHIEVTSDQSLKTGDHLHLNATKSIRLTEGFRMEPGSFLALRVIPETSGISQEDAEVGITFFPNPGKDVITIMGSFDQSRLEIVTAEGLPHSKVLLSGVDPVVNISGLRSGGYILRIEGSSSRLLKE